MHLPNPARLILRLAAVHRASVACLDSGIRKKIDRHFGVPYIGNGAPALAPTGEKRKETLS